MKVHVQYTAQLRVAVGRQDEEIELSEGSSLGQLLRSLAARGGRDAEQHLLTDRGQVRPSLLLVLNDTAVSSNQVDSTVLHCGDKVILLPIGGG